MATSASSLRVMIDANILMSGVVWPRWQYAILEHARNADFQLVLTETVIREAHTRILEEYPRSLPRFEAFIANTAYDLAKEPTKADILKHRQLVRDITDVPIAVAAIRAKLDYFVTLDKDFTDKVPETQAFQKLVHVVLPAIFLKEAMGWTSEQLEAIRKRTWRDLPDTQTEE